MIAFGTSLTVPEIFDRCARPGLDRAAERDSRTFVLQGGGSVFRTYNIILDQAAAIPDLEAVVLVHQDAEIVDMAFCAKLRDLLHAAPNVAIVGCLGAIAAPGLAWWEGTVTWSSCVFRHGESGYDVPARSWSVKGDPTAGQRPGEVDVVDGCLLVLSSWAVRNLRFDEALSHRHGYEFDICRQARHAGRSVAAADLHVVHHHALNLVTDHAPWIAASARFAAKWDDDRADDTEWRRRARRAEAEAAAARLLVASRQYQADALAKQREHRLAEVTQSMSWRVTAPLRRINGIRRRMTARRPL